MSNERFYHKGDKLRVKATGKTITVHAHASGFVPPIWDDRGNGHMPDDVEPLPKGDAVVESLGKLVVDTTDGLERRRLLSAVEKAIAPLRYGETHDELCFCVFCLGEHRLPHCVDGGGVVLMEAR